MEEVMAQNPSQKAEFDKSSTNKQEQGVTTGGTTSGTAHMSSIPGGKAGQKADEGKDTLAKGQEIAADLKSKAQDYGTQAFDRFSGYLEDYPMQSLLVGFGVGCLVGVLIGRR
jgi:ElaB/YqjD/DUF883 family membrane-anchored ribosome-binding protein